MDTFAQQFTTTWISGGVRIKVQMANSEMTTVWHLDNAVESGIISSGSTNYFYDHSKSWTLGQWDGYYAGWTSGIGTGCTRQITSTSTVWVYWVLYQEFPSNVSGAYGIFTSPSDFYSTEEFIDYGTGITPNTVKLELFTWDSSYSTTVSGTSLVTDYATVASESIENDECWIYLFWDSLPVGTYLWRVTPIDGNDTGSLKVLYDSDSTKFQSWKNTSLLSGDYYSEILGLETVESYENVMSSGDSFDGGFIANDGVSNVKVNKGSSYYSAIKTGSVATTAGGLKGRIATGSRVKIV